MFSLQLSHPCFIHSPLSSTHLLGSPLVKALSSLSSFDDEPITTQLIHLILNLSVAARRSVFADFITWLSDYLASSVLVWSCRQLFTVMSFRVILRLQFVDFETVVTVNDV
uniref:Uncharacterized protein n=1 Tax=Fagus sylvatica TaxID=28930 RepID=A0A2N9IZ46_FAGSY